MRATLHSWTPPSTPRTDPSRPERRAPPNRAGALASACRWAGTVSELRRAGANVPDFFGLWLVPPYCATTVEVMTNTKQENHEIPTYEIIHITPVHDYASEADTERDADSYQWIRDAADFMDPKDATFARLYADLLEAGWSPAG
jgi:hypothetical protein